MIHKICESQRMCDEWFTFLIVFLSVITGTPKNCFFTKNLMDVHYRKGLRCYFAYSYLYSMTRMVQQTTTWGTSQIIELLFIFWEELVKSLLQEKGSFWGTRYMVHYSTLFQLLDVSMREYCSNYFKRSNYSNYLMCCMKEYYSNYLIERITFNL